MNSRDAAEKKSGVFVMTSKPSPNIEPEEMKKILTNEETGYLALCDEGEPYVVPMSYAYLDGKIFAHCALTGRKLDIIKKNSKVCFVVSRHPDRAKPHHAAGKCIYRYESVMCFGEARIVEKPEERLPLLIEFKRHFYARLGLDTEKDPVTMKAAEHCGCIVISINSMTGRKKNS